MSGYMLVILGKELAMSYQHTDAFTALGRYHSTYHGLTTLLSLIVICKNVVDLLLVLDLNIITITITIDTATTHQAMMILTAISTCILRQAIAIITTTNNTTNPPTNTNTTTSTIITTINAADG